MTDALEVASAFRLGNRTPAFFLHVFTPFLNMCTTFTRARDSLILPIPLFFLFLLLLFFFQLFFFQLFSVGFITESID